MYPPALTPFVGSLAWCQNLHVSHLQIWLCVHVEPAEDDGGQGDGGEAELGTRELRTLATW